MKHPTRLLIAIGLVAALGACSDDAAEKQAASPTTATAVAGAQPTATTGAAPATTSLASESTAPGAEGSAPSHIISLSAAATEMLFAIGAGPQVIAVDALSNYPADAPVTDLSGFEPNVEAIAAMEPDLVVLSDDINNVVAGLGALTIPVVQTPAAVTIDDTYAELVALGDATGHRDEAAQVIKSMQVDIAKIVADATAKAPTTARTYYHELDPTYFSATSKTFIGQIYSSFGLVNIADAASKADDGGYPQLSAEYIVAADPDMMFLADVKCCQMTAASVGARAGWASLKAVTSGGVVELDDDIASRWGPRVVDQYRAVAAALSEVPVG